MLKAIIRLRCRGGFRGGVTLRSDINLRVLGLKIRKIIE
jgi:hypothetical protein